MLLRKSTESNVDKATEQAILWVQMTNIHLAFVLNSLPQCYSTCCSPPLLPNYTRVDLTATFKEERSWETKTFLERYWTLCRPEDRLLQGSPFDL